MRYGLSDVRNYDSIELARSLAWFAPLYEPGRRAATSRRDDHLERRAPRRERLREASVAAVVAATPPPPGAFARVDRVGAVWVARLDGAPLGRRRVAPARLDVERDHGSASGRRRLPRR